MYKKYFGINGFGRIGRAIFRKALERGDFEIPIINDINPDNNNLAYQLKYDSIYGVLPMEVTGNEEGIVVNGKQYKVFHIKKINEVPWKGVDCVIDSSGIKENLSDARKLVEQGIKYTIVTNSPDEIFLDRSVIIGVNEEEIDFQKDKIISSSICDATAFAPVIKLLDSAYGVEHGFLTTIHPWLQHQHLLDGPSTSWSKPGQINLGYEEGRASTFSLLPKPTSCVSATCKVLKSLKNKFDCFSYRAPTPIVSTANINIKLKEHPSKEQIIALFAEAEKKQRWKIFSNNFGPLVSIDFKGNEHSAIVDHRWTTINDAGYARIVLWYDNEQGYSSRVLDLAEYLLSNKKD